MTLVEREIAMIEFEIAEASSQDADELARVLAPAFADKVEAVVGDMEKALKVLPHLISSIEGFKLVARTGDRTCGAILVSTVEPSLGASNSIRFLRILGLSGARKAKRYLDDYKSSEPDRIEGDGWLEAVGVLEEFRGNGIGTKLTAAGAGELKKAGRTGYALGVKEGNPARAMYEKVGFSVVEPYSNLLGDWLWMRKPL